MEYLRQKRIVRTFSFLMSILILLVIRLVYIQLVENREYACMAIQEETHAVILEDIPRGEILDRQGRSLTGSQVDERIVVFPALIKNKFLVVKDLSLILKVDPKVIMEEIKGSPCYLPYSLSEAQIRYINCQKWPGVKIMPVLFRYGHRPLAAQIIGYVGKIDSREELASLSRESSKKYEFGDWVGKMGLERYYEQELKATRPQRLARLFMDAQGRVVNGPGIVQDTGTVDPGRLNLVLTIDFKIQKVVEEIMDKTIKKGAVVVIDVKTGDILAAASRPGFDPANPKKGTGQEKAFLDYTTSLFIPGSVFKVVIAAGALEEGLVTSEDIFNCSGAKDSLIKCWYAPGHGLLSFKKAFSISCNPVFAHLGLRLGAEKVIEYARKLGFANQEVAGYPRPIDKRQKLEIIATPSNLVNSSVGQWPVMATPIQISAMMNTIINNGKYLQPRLVKELRDSNGKVVKRIPLKEGKKVISSSTALEMRHLLESVTTEGMGKDAFVPGFGSAGKTGSAQVGNGTGTVNAWFSGYAPLKNPRFVVTVLVCEGISGSATAAPVFKEIMEHILDR